MSDDGHDVCVASLGRLQRLAPDAVRAERVRARCQARLRRRRRRTARAAAFTGSASRLLAGVVVGGLCVLYVILLIAATLRLEGGPLRGG